MAGRLATEHLLGLGRTRIAHITAGATLRAVTDRIAGMRAVLAENGLTAAGVPMHGAWRRAWGAEATERLLASGTAFDAVFAGNDEIALGARASLEAAGLRVPDDVALVGVDNFARLTRMEDRSLTTIDLDLPRLGAAAAEHVLRAIAGEVATGQFTVPATLVPGRSTLGDLVRDDPPRD